MSAVAPVYVTTNIRMEAAPASAAPWNLVPFARRVSGMSGSPIDRSISLLQNLERPVISFAMGCPPPDAIPIAALAGACDEIWAQPVASAFNYGPTEGEAALRTAILGMLVEEGMRLQSDQLIVTAGGTQGIDLVCKLFIDEGDVVICETPTYTNGVEIIRAYQGIAVGIASDEEGLQVDLIPGVVDRVGRAPKAFYVIPSFQNPTGRTLSSARRQRLLELASEYGAIVLEDDPYGRLYFEERPPPTLWEIDGGAGRVVSVHTFSKILAPGLRVGWVQAHPSIIRRMIDAKQALDTCTNVFGQRLVASFLDHGCLGPQLWQLRRNYARKLRLMLEWLKTAFADLPQVTWTVPKGGFFIWLKLPDEVNSERLCDQALSEGVAIVSGTAFYVDGGEQAVRLCFASASLVEIRDGVTLLRHAIDRCGKPLSSSPRCGT